MKNKKTKKYKYSYYGRHIFKDLFEKAVPENWEDEVIDGVYSGAVIRLLKLTRMKK